MFFKKMSKRAIVLAFALFFGLAASAQHPFTIKGQLGASVQGKIVLTFKRHGKQVIDSARVTNGTFLIKNNIADPCAALLELNRPSGVMSMNDFEKIDRKGLFIDAGNITVNGDSDLRSANIKGGKSQADNLAYVQDLKPGNDKINALNVQLQQYRAAKNDTAIKSVNLQYEKTMASFEAINTAFVNNHPDSYVAFQLFLNQYDGGVIDPDLEPLFKRFSTGIQHSEGGEEIAARIALAKRLDKGKPAPGFTLNDTLGHPVSLLSLKGKNVLLSFWYGNFYNLSDYSFLLGKINRRLHDKNFVILNIYYNYDKNDAPERWTSLITANSMDSYLNVIDTDGVVNGAGAVSATAKAYGLNFQQLPQLYLIGPDGNILGRNLNPTDNSLALKIEKLIK